MRVRSAEFQSLIGRLKTRWAFLRGNRVSRFQSLIGRLKTTDEDLGGEISEFEFQSLIGRLKTLHDLPP